MNSQGGYLSYKRRKRNSLGFQTALIEMQKSDLCKNGSHLSVLLLQLGFKFETKKKDKRLYGLICLVVLSEVKITELGPGIGNFFGTNLSNSQKNLRKIHQEKSKSVIAAHSRKFEFSGHHNPSKWVIATFPVFDLYRPGDNFLYVPFLPIFFQVCFRLFLCSGSFSLYFLSTVSDFIQGEVQNLSTFNCSWNEGHRWTSLFK